MYVDPQVGSLVDLQREPRRCQRAPRRGARNFSSRGAWIGASPPPILCRMAQSLSTEALDAAALSKSERRVVERLVGSLQDELADDLRAVWLYGSRARGDAAIDETDPDLRSDVDLMVIADGGRQRYDDRVQGLTYAAAADAGESPVWYSVFVFDPEWLRGRRAIESFFIQNVDRDKLVL